MRAFLFAALLGACAQPEQRAETAPPPPEPQTEAPRSEAPVSTATQSVEQALASMPSWENARAQGVDFRGVGQEPGWLLDIYTADRMVLLWDYGENRIETPRGEPDTRQEGVTRYEGRSGGHTLVVTIRRAPCEDAMSGQPYPARVEVAIDGRTLTGCGRSV